MQGLLVELVQRSKMKNIHHIVDIIKPLLILPTWAIYIHLDQGCNGWWAIILMFQCATMLCVSLAHNFGISVEWNAYDISWSWSYVAVNSTLISYVQLCLYSCYRSMRMSKWMITIAMTPRFTIRVVTNYYRVYQELVLSMISLICISVNWPNAKPTWTGPLHTRQTTISPSWYWPP